MTEWALANAVVAIAALVQATSSIGFAMIAVPLLALIDIGYVPGPSLFAMIGLSLIMAAREWRHVDYRGLSLLLPGLVVGTALGALALGRFPVSAMGLLFGSMVLIALAVGRIGFVLERSRPALAASGAIAGLMGTMTGIHGPALAVLYQDAPPPAARATIALIFVIASCLSLLSLYANLLFDRTDLIAGLALVPGVLLGYLLAVGAGHRISDALARHVMLALAALSALLLVGRSLWQSAF